MSNGMQLSGLASEMDWQNVVEQLMELERIPIRRKEAEQLQNAEKSTEFEHAQDSSPATGKLRR